MSFFLIDGPVMPYAWGSTTALAQFLGREPSGQPEAELWLGTHPLAPARLLEPTSGAVDLAELVASQPSLLGEEWARRASALPFLFKVLGIGKPLSLQAHPTHSQARVGFEREEERGVPADSPERNYRDSNHKPEVLLALSPVEAVCGFRPLAEMARFLRLLGLAEPTSVLQSYVADLETETSGIEALFQAIYRLSTDELGKLIPQLMSRAHQLAGTGTPDFDWSLGWLQRLHEMHGLDPGLLGFVLLRPVRLQPGEALFVEPQKLHAYLSGLGVEIMASSDNVLRGGLTQKHVDPEELCRILDFTPSPALTLREDRDQGADLAVSTWRAPAPEFQLLRYQLSGGEAPIVGPSLLLVTRGKLELRDAQRTKELGVSAQAFCGADGVTLVRGSGEFFCATVPPPAP